MKIFNITKPDDTIREKIVHKINNLTKPKGSLGTLEDIALQVGLIQQTTNPILRKPHNIIFAADHGIADEGVSFSPKEVTWQQTLHFPKGGGGVNFLCHQHGFTLKVVDAGVDYDFPAGSGVIDRKVRKGTANFLYAPAMTKAEMRQCIEHGAAIVRESHEDGCNIISFGEMGIGNTSPSSIWMSYFTGIPLEKCVGAGSGLDNAGVQHKYTVLKKAMDNYKGDCSLLDLISHFGGLEMVMAIGGMLQAAELKMIILVDGFIMTNCILVASMFYPQVLDYAIFGHQGDETGHKQLLEYMKVKPLLNLGLRLGEGTGAICAYPIVDSAVRMINEMDSFRGAEVTKYF
ncbi:nicotinate-nucleotide--dimethylbenzimidazole phosphoribosyltransferase [Bacteroides sp. 51]|uniref:nicotinate-nucleotide--dimethylbenzimidazole phosphoribosyltransferase n=1 Tax=Bacteroides sp. 51 TaxID=2302938 RepID=UPI0013D77319|nr:nicotinate-nucleotide--dimethylbenzimidazole phosphoribosyltransferase [Bacteroides sp. 51]NDV82012.1 nicotinate-nucleotide--dimethylbenzimidazole phosphoribosyltransferase [Bacteroides sp. 51]